MRKLGKIAISYSKGGKEHQTYLSLWTSLSKKSLGRCKHKRVAKLTKVILLLSVSFA